MLLWGSGAIGEANVVTVVALVSTSHWEVLLMGRLEIEAVGSHWEVFVTQVKLQEVCQTPGIERLRWYLLFGCCGW